MVQRCVPVTVRCAERAVARGHMTRRPRGALRSSLQKTGRNVQYTHTRAAVRQGARLPSTGSTQAFIQNGCKAP
jgi:hypothetical protein